MTLHSKETDTSFCLMLMWCIMQIKTVFRKYLRFKSAAAFVNSKLAACFVLVSLRSLSLQLKAIHTTYLMKRSWCFRFAPICCLPVSALAAIRSRSNMKLFNAYCVLHQTFNWQFQSFLRALRNIGLYSTRVWLPVLVSLLVSVKKWKQ